MNIIKELSKDFSKAKRDKIVAYIGKDKERFKELIEAFLNGPYRQTQRAAWPLSYAIKKNPSLIKPHLNRVIRNLSKPSIHDAVKRNTVRFLQSIDIPSSLQGEALDTCFKFLQSPKEPIAIKVFSMTVIANLAKEHPEIQNELKTIIEDQMPYGSAGFRSRGSKILKQMEKTGG
ncbi:MAG: hypothetical protein RLN86_01825 [Cyclobacteriaceae bacterium]